MAVQARADARWAQREIGVDNNLMMVILHGIAIMDGHEEGNARSLNALIDAIQKRSVFASHVDFC